MPQLSISTRAGASGFRSRTGRLGRGAVIWGGFGFLILFGI